METPHHLSLHEQATASLSKAKEFILTSIPNDEIVSIYVKGSYVQDALRPDSDVDVVVILQDDEHLAAVYELSEKFGATVQPPFQIVAYTVAELRTGEWSSKRIKHPTPVSVFVKHLDQLPLLYGAKPEGKLFMRTDIKDLTALMSAFETKFLPDFAKGNFKFDELVKQVLWLVEREQRALGIIPDYSWQKLADSITDKHHIIHSALALRKQKEVSVQEQEIFIKRLGEYILELKDAYNRNND